MKKYLVLILFTFLATTVAVGQTNYQDVVYLKNGGIIRGVIIEQVPNKSIKIEKADRSIFVYLINEIDKITKEQINGKTFDDEEVSQNILPIKKGNILLGGNIGANYTSSKMESINYTNSITTYLLSFSPNIGYFFIDNLAIGITTSLEYNWSKSNYYTTGFSNPFWQTSKGDAYTIGIGPYAKYYFQNGFFTSIEALYLYKYLEDKQTQLENNITADNNQSTYEISPSFGYAFFLSQKVSLETSIKYQYDITDYNFEAGNAKLKNNGIYLNIGFQIFL